MVSLRRLLRDISLLPSASSRKVPEVLTPFMVLLFDLLEDDSNDVRQRASETVQTLIGSNIPYSPHQSSLALSLHLANVPSENFVLHNAVTDKLLSLCKQELYSLSATGLFVKEKENVFKNNAFISRTLTDLLIRHIAPLPQEMVTKMLLTANLALSSLHSNIEKMKEDVLLDWSVKLDLFTMARQASDLLQVVEHFSPLGLPEQTHTLLEELRGNCDRSLWLSEII